MGHSLLGDPPKTHAWKVVVGLVQGGGSVPQIAHAVLGAAIDGLQGAEDNRGLIESVYLLMQLPLAARQDDPATALRTAGVDVPDRFALPDLMVGLAQAMRDAFPRNEGKDDIAEIARKSLHSAVGNILETRATGLDGITHDSIVDTLAGLGTRKEFGIVGKAFFTEFIRHYVGQYLERELHQHVGVDRRFRTLERAEQFTDAVHQHCAEMAVLVEKYTGGWYTKALFERDGALTRDDARGYLWKAVGKVREEFTREAQRTAPPSQHTQHAQH